MLKKFKIVNDLVNRTFRNKKICLMLLVIVLISLSGYSKKVEADDKGLNELKGYPIASDVFTTHQKTVIPDVTRWAFNKIFPYEVSKYKKYGYGTWHYGPGIQTIKRLDLMPSSYTGATAKNTAGLLNFFTVTDIHITDEETPAQAIAAGYKGQNSSAYSPVIMYSTQVLDAAVQTINAIHKKTPFDFGIFLGDAINNMQYNELRWYIDVLDGKEINPDSGVKDDPVPGPYNDYQDKFKAAGLDKTIPWYQTLGNHDQLHMGVGPLDDYLRKVYVGEEILNVGDIFNDPLGMDSRGTYMGSIDGRTRYGDVIGVGPVKDFKTPPRVLAADPNRCPLTRNEWMSEFLKTASKPVGHGFTEANIDKGFACYSFEPKSNIPIKVIVLDDNQMEPDFDIHEQGSLDEERFNWLVSELDEGQTEGKLMIISSHIPIYLIGVKGHSPVTKERLISKLNTYPNLMMWLSGHYHQNTVTAYKSPDASRPELGFWLVETSSLRDFPQQFRTFDIVRNSDNTVSIFTTNVDTAVKNGSLAAISRSYSIATQQLVKNNLNYLPSGSYNAELVKQLSPDMQDKLRKYGTPVSSKF